MNLQEILSLNITGKNVAILGIASAGKTYLSKELGRLNPYHLVFHTDDYIEHGFETSMYIILMELSNVPKGVPIMLEGVGAYRALRKSVQPDVGDCVYKPDIVITCEISKKKQQEIYTKKRDPKKLKYMQAFELGNMKVYNDYMKLLEKEDYPPQFITFDNNY